MSSSSAMMSTELLKKKFEDVVFGKDDRSSFAKTLSLVSKGYGLAMDLRAKMYGTGILETKSLPCKVVAVGNLTLGGTGKTPMVVCVAKLAQSMGLRPAVVCRGYGGSCEHGLGIASDGRRILMGPAQCGDEPRLIAASLPGVPVVVGKDRFASGLRAVQVFDPDLVVLDDAYQHLRLKREVNLLLMDSRSPLGNGKVFPCGILREPVRQAGRADAVIATRSDPSGSESDFFKQNPHVERVPLFRCRHAPGRVSRLNADGFWEPCEPERIAGEKCLAFSGIANNEDFKRLLREIGCEPRCFLSFDDHHRYCEKDVRAIREAAIKCGANKLVATEKDGVKLAGFRFSGLEMYTAGVRIAFLGQDENRFIHFMKQRLDMRQMEDENP